MSSSAHVPDPADARPEAFEQSGLGEVSDVLLNLEHTIARAKKGLARVQKAGDNPNVEHALKALIKDLTIQHKRLMQDTYYAGNAIRLM